MSSCDEPLLGPEHHVPFTPPEQDLILEDRIRHLIDGEAFAVLCTQGEGQPYGSLVAFAFGPDLSGFAFATPVATRKYRLLSECQRVALLVDNRSKYAADMMQISAVTATGRASQVEAGPEFDKWADLLMARHPYLRGFVLAPSSALFRVDVVRCLYVSRFQEVHQWVPTTRR
jgi:nitroimidazol reductase NimA-like FMN-containing flavoprotein (pyridoxamine 5'-phosphate oxidase superfamily)